MEELKVKSLSLRIGQKVLLNDIDLSVLRGQTLIIVGESGSGKTLLSQLLMGEKPKDSVLTGDVYFRNQSLIDCSAKSLRSIRGSKIAYLTQNPMSSFNPFITIERHFTEMLASHSNLAKRVYKDRVYEILKQVRLGHQDKMLRAYPFELSGGMLQRLMLALLLITNPDVFILDEPTSSLDKYNRNHLIQIFKNLQAQHKTLLVTTHDFDLARQLSGYMIVLNQGKIVDQGLTKDLLEHPNHPYSKQLLLAAPFERLWHDTHSM